MKLKTILVFLVFALTMPSLAESEEKPLKCSSDDAVDMVSEDGFVITYKKGCVVSFSKSAVIHNEKTGESCLIRSGGKAVMKGSASPTDFGYEALSDDIVMGYWLKYRESKNKKTNECENDWNILVSVQDFEDMLRKER